MLSDANCRLENNISVKINTKIVSNFITLTSYQTSFIKSSYS